MNNGSMFSLLCFTSTLFFGLVISPVGAHSATDGVQKDGNEAGEKWSELFDIDAADPSPESTGPDASYTIEIEADEAVRAGNDTPVEAGDSPALKEISVLKGEDFTIRLREAGWYPPGTSRRRSGTGAGFSEKGIPISCSSPARVERGISSSGMGGGTCTCWCT